MPENINTNYLESIHKLFRYYKSLGEKAMAQINEEQIHWQPNEQTNNVAIIVKHMAGNQLSRWTNFLTEDGEKSWRNREDEFEHTIKTKEELLQVWERGWNCLFSAIDPLTPSDLEKIIYIRNEGHTVTEAINRQLTHYAYHVGQIVFLAKMLQAADWKYLSVPKGDSKKFNEEKFKQDKKRKHFI